MTRKYADPVDVRRADDAPAAFVWRGRRYWVHSVLGHWLEAGGWWSRAAPDNAEAVGGRLDEGEREVWRVEAGPAGSAGVYDLQFDWSAGNWVLTRVLD